MCFEGFVVSLVGLVYDSVWGCVESSEDISGDEYGLYVSTSIAFLEKFTEDTINVSGGVSFSETIDAWFCLFVGGIFPACECLALVAPKHW